MEATAFALFDHVTQGMVKATESDTKRQTIMVALSMAGMMEFS